MCSNNLSICLGASVDFSYESKNSKLLKYWRWKQWRSRTRWNLIEIAVSRYNPTWKATLRIFLTMYQLYINKLYIYIYIYIHCACLPKSTSTSAMSEMCRVSEICEFPERGQFLKLRIYASKWSRSCAGAVISNIYKFVFGCSGTKRLSEPLKNRMQIIFEINNLWLLKLRSTAKAGIYFVFGVKIIFFCGDRMRISSFL